MTQQNYQPVVELTRGRIVELIHFGAVAVVDSSGRLLASVGDASIRTFLRSSAKPFQALPFIERGGDQALGLSAREVALICASHAGTDMHLAAVDGLQQKLGLHEQDLLCGTHPPFDAATARAMEQRGEAPRPNRHNCSGKHTGMLAHAVLRGLPTEDYINPDHPVQQSILAAFAEMCGLAVDEVEVGVDGCSAPNFAVPLRSAALAVARLLDPSGLTPERAAACRRITAAMIAYPEMVDGPGRFDTRLMELGSGRVVAKHGAEAYQIMGIQAGSLGPEAPALGIAMKVSDGDLSERAAPLVALEILRQLGILSKQDLENMGPFGPRPLYNWRRIQVGEVRPCFDLERQAL